MVCEPKKQTDNNLWRYYCKKFKEKAWRVDVDAGTPNYYKIACICDCFFAYLFYIQYFIFYT